MRNMIQQTNWGYMKRGDKDHIYREDGTKQKLSCEKYKLPWGEYKGIYLSDVYDTNYLTWMNTALLEKKEWFIKKMVGIRLDELTEAK